MFNLGVPELGVIAGIVLLLFGPRQIPRIGRSLGKTLKELRGVRRELVWDGDDNDEKGWWS